MTTAQHLPDEDHAHLPRRLVTIGAAIMVMVAILLGVGLTKSMQARRMLCPQANPDCGLPPPPATR